MCVLCLFIVLRIGHSVRQDKKNIYVKIKREKKTKFNTKIYQNSAIYRLQEDNKEEKKK